MGAQIPRDRVTSLDPQQIDRVLERLWRRLDRFSSANLTDVASIPVISPTTGAIIRGSSASPSVWESLAVGASGKVLRSSGTLPVYSTFTVADTYSRGDIVRASAANTLGGLAVGAAGKVIRSDGTDPLYSTFTIPDTYVQGDMLYASAANVLTALAKDTNATRYLSNTGASNNPAWAQVNLANGVTGTLPVANGGTNRTSWTAGRIVYVGSGGTSLTEDASFTFSSASNYIVGLSASVGGGGVVRFSTTNTSTAGAADFAAFNDTSDGVVLQAFGSAFGGGMNSVARFRASGGISEFHIQASSATCPIIFHQDAGNVERWRIAVGGNFLAGSDNTYDIGASGATRPRTIYAGTSFVAPAGAVSTPSYTFTSDTDTGWYSTGSDTIRAAFGGTASLLAGRESSQNNWRFGYDRNEVCRVMVYATGGTSGNAVFRAAQGLGTTPPVFQYVWGYNSSDAAAGAGSAGQVIGRTFWYSPDSAQNVTAFGQMDCVSATVTDGAEVGRFDFYVTNAGSLPSTPDLGIGIGGIGVGIAPVTTSGVLVAHGTNALTARVADSGTTNRPSVATFQHLTSGTAATNYGLQLSMQGESDAGTARTMGILEWFWNDATNGGEDSVFRLYCMAAGTASFGFEQRSSTTASIYNYGFVANAAGSYGGGQGVIFVANAGTTPSSNPTAGGILYSTGGAGTWRGSGGTTTTFGPAKPYCDRCGLDDWASARWNEEQSWYHFECAWCGADYRSHPLDAAFSRRSLLRFENRERFTIKQGMELGEILRIMNTSE